MGEVALTTQLRTLCSQPPLWFLGVVFQDIMCCQLQAVASWTSMRKKTTTKKKHRANKTATTGQKTRKATTTMKKETRKQKNGGHERGGGSNETEQESTQKSLAYTAVVQAWEYFSLHWLVFISVGKAVTYFWATGFPCDWYVLLMLQTKLLMGPGILPDSLLAFPNSDRMVQHSCSLLFFFNVY